MEVGIALAYFLRRFRRMLAMYRLAAALPFTRRAGRFVERLVRRALRGAAAFFALRRFLVGAFLVRTPTY